MTKKYIECGVCKTENEYDERYCTKCGQWLLDNTVISKVIDGESVVLVLLKGIKYIGLYVGLFFVTLALIMILSDVDTKPKQTEEKKDYSSSYSNSSSNYSISNSSSYSNNSSYSKKDVENQFSAWDGSHRKSVEIIKSLMKNPDSFKHVKTTYTQSDKDITVCTKYRGTNSFNAVTTEDIIIIFELNYNGSIKSVSNIIQ